MFSTRILPSHEWPRLHRTPMGQALASLPAHTKLVVVEDADGVIVGTWAGMRFVHFEGVWIADAHQKRAAVAGRLLRGMNDVAREWGADVVLTGAETDDVRRLITKLGGQQLPGDHYALPVPRCR